MDLSNAWGAVAERLLSERIVFLGGEVTDELAFDVTSKLLLLESMDPERDISLYIHSPGGSVDAGMAIHDTMNFVRCDVATICLGMAASMGQFLLACGAPGKRSALAHARILMHQPLGRLEGRASEIANHAAQIARIKVQMAEILSHRTGQTAAQIQRDWDRDRWFDATDALAYGIIDRVVTTAPR